MDYWPLFAYLIVFILYRIIESSASVRAGAFRRKPKWEWTLPLILGTFVLIVIGPPLEYLFFGTNPGPFSLFAGGTLFLLGAVFRAKGLLDLGKGFSLAIERVEGQSLIETGIYHHIRHPLYLGTICLYTACPVFLGAYRSLFLTALGLAAIFIRMRREEVFLSEAMPGYREYRERTWALIPHIY